MFPDSFLENTDTESTTEGVGTDFLFDYETGQHIMQNGLLVESSALQGVQQYIQNVLRTQANIFGVYTNDETEVFGISVYEYLHTRTLHDGYLNSELKREITQQLLTHPLISSISDWKGEREKQGLHIYFTVTLTDSSIIEVSEVV